MRYEKKTYIPGAVASRQKPWYKREWPGDIKYRGRFCKPGYPDEIILSFGPLIKLIGRVDDQDLKDEMLDLIEEMQDAHYAEKDNHIKSLGGLWD